MRIAKGKARTVLHETPAKSRMEEHHFVNKDLRQQIEKKAYELYQGRGCVHGRDLDDWLEAEALLTAGKR